VPNLTTEMEIEIRGAGSMKLRWPASWIGRAIAASGGAAVIVPLLGAIVVGVLQILVGYDVANRSNAFDSPNIALMLYNIPLQPNERTDVYVGAEEDDTIR
jgi:hypothetical protein